MNRPSLDMLAIETISWVPHLETSGEVCVKEARSGKAVGFVFIDVDNPDDQIAPRVRLVGGRRMRRVAAMKRVLSGQGVRVIDATVHDRGKREAAEAFAAARPRSVVDLRGLMYRGAALGLGAVSSLISRVRDPHPDPVEHADLVQRYLRSSALVYEAALDLLRRYRPKSVLLFNGRFACVKPIFEAAKQLDIPCVFHERGATKERYELFEKEPHDPVYVRQLIRSAWEQADDKRERIGAEYFLRRRAGDGIGWISYTDGQQKSSVPPRKAARRLVYFSSSDDEFESVGDLCKHYIFDSQRHAVQFLIDWAAKANDIEFIIRVHPILRASAFRERNWWESLGGRNVTVLPADDITDSYALAGSADLVLAHGSTMGVEAAYLGKPSVVVGEAAYRGLGCNYEPASRDSLCELLSRPSVSPLPVANCLPFGYYYLTFGRMYELYNPRALNSGTFLGEELSVEPRLTRALKASWLGRRARRLVHLALDA